MSQHEEKKERRKSRHGFWTGLILGGLLATVLAGGLAFSSVKAAGQWFAGPGAHGRFGSMSPEMARERVGFAVELVLGRVDASESQTEEVKAILANSMGDLYPLMAEHKDNRQAFVAVLSKPDIDRHALEELRKAEMALADQGSSRFVSALADIAEVLTPEQRTELIELAERFHR